MLAVAWVYGHYNPGTSAWFPRCPFKTLTGWDCPGCGSQRAIHSLLNWQVGEALSHNLLLVLSIPYILVWPVLNLPTHPDARLLRWRKRLYGPVATKIILVVIIAFWVLRNVFVFFS
ncbi:MAG: DUF2752 domain-containing protein [Prevotellaceae bacterium]|nr:DUF2752 domain-containing protein [Prevotellaceae bacterium]